MSMLNCFLGWVFVRSQHSLLLGLTVQYMMVYVVNSFLRRTKGALECKKRSQEQKEFNVFSVTAHRSHYVWKGSVCRVFEYGSSFQNFTWRLGLLISRIFPRLENVLSVFPHVETFNYRKVTFQNLFALFIGPWAILEQKTGFPNSWTWISGPWMTSTKFRQSQTRPKFSWNLVCVCLGAHFF